MRTRIACMTAFAVGLSLSLSLSATATEHPHKSPAHSAARGPKAIGTFGDWIAATYQQAGHTVCYAFTRAQASTPSLPGRGQVVLTVTQRPDQRDSVAIEVGFDYAPKAAVTVQVDQTGLDFYTAQRNAFARDGKAAVAAFQRGERAIARSPGPHGHQVTDTFSLKGFSAAYAAVVKACPPGK
jgi:invasion protein IalB